MPQRSSTTNTRSTWREVHWNQAWPHLRPDIFTAPPEGRLQSHTMVGTRRYPVLSGAFLVMLALALVLVSWAVGTENYPYIHQRVVYRFPLATLDRIYLIALGILALHYAAYVAHYLMV